MSLHCESCAGNKLDFRKQGYKSDQNARMSNFIYPFRPRFDERVDFGSRFSYYFPVPQ